MRDAGCTIGRGISAILFGRGYGYYGCGEDDRKYQLLDFHGGLRYEMSYVSSLAQNWDYYIVFV